MTTIIRSVLISLLMTLQQAIAADIFVDHRTTEPSFIHLRGEIVRGDSQKIIALIRKSPEEFLIHDWQLDSNGGDILEAMKIGDLIKDLYITVNITAAGARCASACFFIYVSALNRNAHEDAVGVHRPYFPDEYFANLTPEQAEAKYAQMSKSVRTFLVEKGVPNALIERMFSLASNEVYWLNGSDLEDLGNSPAWFDQYLVAKCGFNNRMFNEAAARHDEAQAKKWARCATDIEYAQGLIAVEKYVRKLPRSTQHSRQGALESK